MVTYKVTLLSEEHDINATIDCSDDVFVLDAAEEQGNSLLDSTMVLYGSNMGDSNTHENTNLPILLAGGSFNHGRHIAFDRDDNTPLCSLFVTMAQYMGVETDKFGSSEGALQLS